MLTVAPDGSRMTSSRAQGRRTRSRADWSHPVLFRQPLHAPLQWEMLEQAADGDQLRCQFGRVWQPARLLWHAKASCVT